MQSTLNRLVVEISYINEFTFPCLALMLIPSGGLNLTELAQASFCQNSFMKEGSDLLFQSWEHLSVCANESVMEGIKQFADPSSPTRSVLRGCECTC